MAVLVEGISVIVRHTTLEAKYPGGWQAFATEVPNHTLCSDTEIARVGFMAPNDVESYVSHLETYGLRFLVDGECDEIAVVDQLRGPTLPCDWLEFGHTCMSGTSNHCAACRLLGSRSDCLYTPEGWVFEGSLSDRPNLVPTSQVDQTMKFLRHENGLDVYLDRRTGKEVYVGRTS